MLPRFYIHSSITTDNDILIQEHGIVKQLLSVLRIHRGSKFVVFDNTGYDYVVSVKDVESDRISAEILEKRTGNREPKHCVILYQSLLKSDHFELVLQKGVEIGVTVFVPIITQRTVVRSISENKRERYEKIIIEATEQCGGVRIAQLEKPVRFATVINKINSEDQCIIAWEGEKRVNLCEYLERCHIQQECTFHVFVGPEGGFTENEVMLAKKQKFISVSLGKRILRSETAALAICSKILL